MLLPSDMKSAYLAQKATLWNSLQGVFWELQIKCDSLAEQYGLDADVVYPDSDGSSEEQPPGVWQVTSEELSQEMRELETVRIKIFSLRWGLKTHKPMLAYPPGNPVFSFLIRMVLKYKLFSLRREFKQLEKPILWGLRDE